MGGGYMTTDYNSYEVGFTLGNKRARERGLEGIYADYFARGFAEGYEEGSKNFSKIISAIEDGCEDDQISKRFNISAVQVAILRKAL